MTQNQSQYFIKDINSNFYIIKNEDNQKCYISHPFYIFIEFYTLSSHQIFSMNLSYVLDVQSDLSYAHPQRTEAIHMHHVSKGILPQFRSQEGNIAFIIHIKRI